MYDNNKHNIYKHRLMSKSYQKLLVKRKVYLHNNSSFQNKINEFNEFKINVFNSLYTPEYWIDIFVQEYTIWTTTQSDVH